MNLAACSTFGVHFRFLHTTYNFFPACRFVPFLFFLSQPIRLRYSHFFRVLRYIYVTIFMRLHFLLLREAGGKCRENKKWSEVPPSTRDCPYAKLFPIAATINYCKNFGLRCAITEKKTTAQREGLLTASWSRNGPRWLVDRLIWPQIELYFIRFISQFSCLPAVCQRFFLQTQ